jgi:hypothetical protein
LHFHHEGWRFCLEADKRVLQWGGNKLEMASNNLTTLQIIFLSFFLAKEGATRTHKKQVHFRRKDCNRHPHKDKVGMGHSEA